MSVTPANDILKFWFDEIEHSSWFKKDAEFDRDLERRFGETLTLARREYGRFPHRNRVLGRHITAEEETYLGDGDAVF